VRSIETRNGKKTTTTEGWTGGMEGGFEPLARNKRDGGGTICRG